MDQRNVLVRPVITEKSMREAGIGNFTFVVATDADKGAIRKAIEDSFNVHVVALQTIISKGKRARVGKRRVELRLSSTKKAIAKLREGERIDLFETTQNEPEKK